MDWSAPIDAYCERTSADFWVEPLNAVTNAAFFVAAFAAILLLRKDARAGRSEWVLVGLIVAIGAGSFLFHTFATRWAALTDVVPINVFIYVYFYLALRRLVDLRVSASLALLALFCAASLGLAAVVPGGTLNGSVSYAPAFLAMLAVGGVLLFKESPAARPVLAAALVFLASLTARTFDHAACGALPVGLHFIWHVLNAVVLYLLVRTLLIHSPPRRTR